ncbi:MAG: AMP-binding protein [Pseudomonadota bacterium]
MEAASLSEGREATSDDRIGQEAIASAEGLLPVIVDLIVDGVIQAGSRGPIASDLRAALRTHPHEAFESDTINLDSLAVIRAASRVAELFAMDRTGHDDFLLMSRDAYRWAALAAQALSINGEVVLRTSGSTDAPKRIVWPIRELIEEARAFAARFCPGRTVVLVPTCHLFGFVFGALVPAVAGVPAVSMVGRLGSAVARDLQPGDLVAATPFLWSDVIGALAASTAPCPRITGVSSGDAWPDDRWREIDQLETLTLCDVFGSTETAAIGLRDGPGPFALAPGISWSAPAPAATLARRTRALPMADRLVRVAQSSGPDGFEWAGRSDDSTTVAGVTVALADVRSVLTAHPAVTAAACRLDRRLATPRLKAFVQVAGDGNPGVVAALHAACRDRLPAVARPHHIAMGPELPRGPSGKLADWPTNPTDD